MSASLISNDDLDNFILVSLDLHIAWKIGTFYPRVNSW
jgi:hypothetical protein